MVVFGLNFAIDAVKGLVVGGVTFAIDKVLTIIAEVAAAAAIIANIVSAVGFWRMDLTAKDPSTRKGIDAEKVYDSVTAKAVLIGVKEDWPRGSSTAPASQVLRCHPSCLSAPR